MDAATLALAKQYTDSQRLGSIESHKVVCDFLTESEIQVPFLACTYRWFSDKMPTLSELKAASVEAKCEINGSPVNTSFNRITVMPSSSGLCTTLWDSDDATLYVGILVAYEAGQHTVIFDGQEYSVEAPRAGLYAMVPDEVFADEVMKNVTSFDIDIAWESVKTIEPKFLPGVCLPLVELETVITPGADLSTPTKISAAESATINSMGGMPFVLKCTIDFGSGLVQFSIIATATIDPGLGAIYTAFTWIELGFMLNIAGEDDGMYVFVSYMNAPSEG